MVVKFTIGIVSSLNGILKPVTLSSGSHTLLAPSSLQESDINVTDFFFPTPTIFPFLSPNKTHTMYAFWSLGYLIQDDIF